MKSFHQRIIDLIRERESRLCVGIDLSPERLGFPDNLARCQEYSRILVAATRDQAVAFKPNLAFFERWGAAGWDWLLDLRERIGPEVLFIADAKRGDIGATAEQYAYSIWEQLRADAVTVNPYLGRDTIEPFCSHPEKGVFVLCRTSNPGRKDVQSVGGSDPVYLRVARWVQEMDTRQNLGLVVGATIGAEVDEIRKAAPDLPFLMPGVGAQGGEIGTCLRARTGKAEVLVNVSRGIALAGDRSPDALCRAAETYRKATYDITG